MNEPNPTSLPPPAPPRRRPAPYVPALGPRMKWLLAALFFAAALLGATGAYLCAISFLNWFRHPLLYTNAFSLWIVVAHVALGLVALAPFLYFGVHHLVTSWNRPNRVAVRLGIFLFVATLLVCATGLGLIQLEGLPQLPTGTIARGLAYWLHVLLPAAGVVLYVLHRRAGPAIRWRWGYAWLGATAAFVVAMIGFHGVDPRQFYAVAPKEGDLYFHPSEARTADGKFIPAKALMMDEYCRKCHAQVYDDHFHSAHKFSSFNNPPYLFSVRETRKVALERDGNVQASRWCAGCHDAVPFFSGAFDDPNFDDVNHPTANAGLTCVVCHAVTNIHSTMGNAAFTIAEPQHYPFAYSDDPTLQWINNQLVKARPDFHKQTFLKPVHRSPEFCSTCHKVSLPVGLNHYKEFLRGQNHYDSFLLSGVSGHGARSFYYPPKAKNNCADCHMPLTPSADFGARDFDGSGERKRHHHGFPAANTGLFALLPRDPRFREHADGFAKAEKMHADFLRDKKLRIDLFGLKDGGSTEPKALLAPLRPDLPKLRPGRKYLIEVVIRTVDIGHPFTQGTADSNEIWVDFKATAGGKVIARSGAMKDEANDAGPVDEWSHFVNVLMLDRNGNRINRRNPQDIFTPLYDHQIGPGAAQIAHYRLDVPADVTGPVELNVRLRYRKFDHEYMTLVHKDQEVPRLPVIDLCADRVTLAVEGGPDVAAQESPIKPPWQRWNDYGIACLLEGGVGAKRGHFRQAEEAFRRLLRDGPPEAASHAHVNLARVYIEEGRLSEAAQELTAAGKTKPPAPWWSLAWFTALVNSETATRKEHLDAVVADLEKILGPDQPRERGFDFSKDYVVRARLANRLFKRSQFEEDGSPEQERFVLRAIRESEVVLKEDTEDVESHDLLKQCYSRLGEGFAPAQGPSPTREDLAALAASLADAKQPSGVRLAAAGQLLNGLETMAHESADPARPRLPHVKDAIAKLRPAFHAEAAGPVRAATAAVLAVLHRESHLAYKPDEIARSRAARLYREKHPAANHAAGDRVIYPTTPEQRDTILRLGHLPEGP